MMKDILSSLRVIPACRRHYNTVRPYSTLGYRRQASRAFAVPAYNNGPTKEVAFPAISNQNLKRTADEQAGRFSFPGKRVDLLRRSFGRLPPKIFGQPLSMSGIDFFASVVDQDNAHNFGKKSVFELDIDPALDMSKGALSEKTTSLLSEKFPVYAVIEKVG